MINEYPITKWILYKNAIRPLAIAIAVFSVCIMAIFLTANLLSSNPLDWKESMLIILSGGLFAFILIIGIGSIPPLYGILRLTKQEISLKFSFSDEMKKHNIRSTDYESYSWFISTKGVTVLAIHRNYIQEIEKIGDSNGRQIRLIAILIKSDGKKMKLSGSYNQILKFERWFLQAETE